MDEPLFQSHHSALLVDFYQLVHAAVYHGDRMWGEVTYDLAPRDLPEDFGYLVFAGLEPALADLVAPILTKKHVRYLRRLPTLAHLPKAFFDAIADRPFEGDVHAVPEGSVVFPGAPVVRVTGPLIQLALWETRLIQAVSHATGVATRASRMVGAAGGRALVEFASSRCPGPQAALETSRAAFIGGFAGTSNVAAGAAFGIPLMGATTETFSALHPDADSALDAFQRHFPRAGNFGLAADHPLLTLRRLARIRDHVRLVRLEAGRNAVDTCAAVRRALADLGMSHVRLLLSGQLDEQVIADLEKAGVEADLFGVGARLVDGPIGGFSWRPSRQWRNNEWDDVRGPGAARWPGLKQVMRFRTHDVVCLETEVEEIAKQGGRALLDAVVLRGDRVAAREQLSVARQRHAASMTWLVPESRRIRDPQVHKVEPTATLAALAG